MDIQKKKQLLTQAFWDKEIDSEKMSAFINGEIEAISFMDEKTMFSRLLSTYDWYTLMALLPHEMLQKALTDDVITRLHPESLKEKYRYVRHILFE